MNRNVSLRVMTGVATLMLVDVGRAQFTTVINSPPTIIVGRLIRTRNDHGIVVLLDPRIRSKHYGRLFLESLPDCEFVEESAFD